LFILADDFPIGYGFIDKDIHKKVDALLPKKCQDTPSLIDPTTES